MVALPGLIDGTLTAVTCVLMFGCPSNSGTSSGTTTSVESAQSSTASVAAKIIASSSSSSIKPTSTTYMSKSTGLAQSKEGFYSNCFYQVDGAGKFNTRWVADWSAGITQDMTNIVSSAYNMGVSTVNSTVTGTPPKKSKRGLINMISNWGGGLSFKIIPSGQRVTKTVDTAVSNVVSVANSAATAVTSQTAQVANSGLSSSTQLYTAYNDILYASVRAVVLLSNATAFTSYRSDTMEIDSKWLQAHSSYDTNIVADAATAWHEYRVDWLPGYSNYYIDNQLVNSQPGGSNTAGLWLWNAFSDNSDDSVFQIRSIDAYFNRTSVAASIANGQAVCSPVVAATSAVGSAVSGVAATATSVVGGVAGTATSVVGGVAGTATSVVGNVASGATSAVVGVATGVVGGVVGGIVGASSTLKTSASVTPSLSAQATVSFTTVTKAWSGKVTSTSTALSGLSATVYVLTPGVVSATVTAAPTASGGYIYTTITTDSGTFSTVQTKTILPTLGTSATIQIVYPTPVTTCGNAGIAYAGYTNIYSGGQAQYGYPNFEPTAFKLRTPSVAASGFFASKPIPTGVTSFLSSANGQSSNVNMYGTDVGTTNFVIDHTFYLFARQDGYYSFNIPYTDDLQLVWLGDKAVTGWTRANADITQFWSSQIATQTPQTIAVYLTTGAYLPVRVMWANGGGIGELDFNVYGPDGSNILASVRGQGTGSSSVDIVQFPCRAAQGVPFPIWGKET